ncbi:MAG: hypothetical protein ACRD4S_12890 [Candidatus Acidiferrales bacterium]
MPLCDGCGAHVDDAHIRGRIERLEQATRFRPIHIKFLILGDAPPGRPADFFYAPGLERGLRSRASRALFDELAIAGGISAASVTSTPEETVLLEFQRGGFFLAYVVECPVADERELDSAVERLAPTVVRRIQTSYRPKHIVPIGSAGARLIPLLDSAGLHDKLILGSEGSAFQTGPRTEGSGSGNGHDSLGSRVHSAIASLL